MKRKAKQEQKRERRSLAGMYSAHSPCGHFERSPTGADSPPSLSPNQTYSTSATSSSASAYQAGAAIAAAAAAVAAAQQQQQNLMQNHSQNNANHYSHNYHNFHTYNSHLQQQRWTPSSPPG